MRDVSTEYRQTPQGQPKQLPPPSMRPRVIRMVGTSLTMWAINAKPANEGVDRVHSCHRVGTLICLTPSRAVCLSFF